MRTLMAIATGILAIAWITTPGAATPPATDIPAISDQIASLSPKDIQAALHSPIPDDQLPPGFSDATFLDQDDATMQTRETGATGSVTFSLVYMPEGDATPDAQAPSRTGGPGRLYNTASTTYLIFDAPLTGDALKGFEDILRAAIGDQATGAEARHITVADQQAWNITVETEINGIPIIMDWVAIPVGKVAVVSMTMSGGESVDRDALLSDAEHLSVAAIDHLRISVEQRGTPAG